MTAEEYVDSIAKWTNGSLRASVIQMVRSVMLEAAERGARAMRIAAMTALYDAGEDSHVVVHLLDSAAIARRSLEIDADDRA